jgi:uncharacterized protein (DUF2252 family)
VEDEAPTDERSEASGRAFASAWRRARLSVDERIERGRVARHETPRSSHGTFVAAPDRLDPITILEAQAQTRVPELIPIRYGRMLVSPFAFYRGGAAIMASDLSRTPDSHIAVQLCGDAHLSNFGLFATPERQLTFDLNDFDDDFDETLPGPWEWDVKRLATSFEVLGRQRRFSPADRRWVVMQCVAAYRRRMRQAASMGTLEAWYEHLGARQLLDGVAKRARTGKLSRNEARTAEQHVNQARSRNSARAFKRHAKLIGDELRIAADPPLIVPIEDLAARGSDWEGRPSELVKQLLSSYRETIGTDRHPLEEFRYVHAARKVVGVGSVGTRCYIVLLVGRDANDPLFLQVKEAQASVLEPYLGASDYAHHGQRVVAGQRIMQAASDIFLGWQRIHGLDGVDRDYYVRQLHDWKGGLNVDRMRVGGAAHYARICGATLGRAHARWGDRIAIAAYLGQSDRFDQAVADFAVAYADQNEQDFRALVSAVESGRMTARTGV